jgi:hypothetical protein
MKLLKSERQYKYDDFRELQCGVCKKKLWGKGREIVDRSRIQCPRCGTVYSFEPTRWRVLADIHVD